MSQRLQFRASIKITGGTRTYQHNKINHAIKQLGLQRGWISVVYVGSGNSWTIITSTRNKPAYIKSIRV